MNILLVDDSNSIAMIVSQMLNKHGFSCSRAKDGKEAIDFINNGSFDLILLDWNMPNMTGIEFLEFNFKENIFSNPIIMMTTENKPEKIRSALKFGASEYIMKPFPEDILLSKINSTI